MEKGKSSMGMEENIASMLCYLVLWITGFIFFFLEKENKTIRFHAIQSILTFLPLTILSLALGFIGAPSASYGGAYGPYGIPSYSINPGIPALVWASWGLSILTFVLWLILIIKAYQGEKFKLPIVGDIAEKHA